MADNKVNSGLLEFSEEQKVFVALDAETSEVKKAVTIDGDGVETDIAGGGGGDVTVEALSVTENGTYSEEGKAYSPVTVNVEGVAGDIQPFTMQLIDGNDNPLSRASFDVQLSDPITGDNNGFLIEEENNVRYINNASSEYAVISNTPLTLTPYHYLNEPIYIYSPQATAAADYTVTGDCEVAAVQDHEEATYMVKAYGNCTITVNGSVTP